MNPLLRKAWNSTWLVKRKRQARLLQLRAQRQAGQEELRRASQTKLNSKRTRGLFSGIELNQKMRVTLFDGNKIVGIFLGLTKTQQKAILKIDGERKEFPVGAIDIIQTSKTKRRAKNARERLSSLLGDKTKKQLAELIRDTRRVNQSLERNGGYRRKSTLQGSSILLGEDIPATIERMLQKKNKIKAIDLGCGNSTILKELKDIFQGKLETHGLDPTLPKKGLFDKSHVGILEQYAFSEKFDLIISLHGATFWAINPAFALQKVCNSLSKGGTAIITIRDYNLENTIRQIQEKGFEVIKNPNGLIINNPAGKTIDLRDTANEQLHTPRSKYDPKTGKFKEWKEKIVMRQERYKNE